jgi:hypothetical protein
MTPEQLWQALGRACLVIMGLAAAWQAWRELKGRDE